MQQVFYYTSARNKIETAADRLAEGLYSFVLLCYNAVSGKHGI
jgi:hypothetical protein